MAGITVFALLFLGFVVLSVPRGQGARERAGPAGPSRPGLTDGPLILDLLGSMLTAGASVEHGLSVVAEACDPSVGPALQRVRAARLLGATWEAAWDVGTPGATPTVAGTGRRRPGHAQQLDRAARARTVEDIRQGLRFATSTGAPSAALLHAHAAQMRRRLNRETDKRAATLGVHLVLPLGLCSLPAFICLGVVPVVLGLLPDL